MGWWQTADGTVIGDEFADICGVHIDKLIEALIERFPDITRNQVLNTLSFCSGYLKAFDKGKEQTPDDITLILMTVEQRNKWRETHSVPADESLLVAPGTGLLNVRNPFTGDIV